MTAVLLVGYGFAGKRFARALSFLARQHPDRVRFAGVVDSDRSKTAGEMPVARVFDDLEQAVVEIRPDAVVLAINEFAHFEALRRLAETSCAILCEKPLTATRQEARRLEGPLARHRLTVNLVERFSPILDVFLDWHRRHPGLEPVRVEFFWGKNRLWDPRPTMGVLSEVTHPLDLVDFLFPFDRWRVAEASGICSEFAHGRESRLDSVQLLLDTGRYPIIGHTSFLWPRRQRSITAFLADRDDRLFRAYFEFDQPHWDCDLLEVREVLETTGELRPVLEHRVTNDDFPAELAGIFKVSEFVRHSLDGVAGKASGGRLVGLEQALKVQSLLEDIEESCKRRRSLRPYSLRLPLRGPEVRVAGGAAGSSRPMEPFVA